MVTKTRIPGNITNIYTQDYSDATYCVYEQQNVPLHMRLGLDIDPLTQSVVDPNADEGTVHSPEKGTASKKKRSV